MAKKVNIIIMGVNYFGMMALSQRAKNLFDPLLNKPEVNISNIIINVKEIENSTDKVATKTIKYNYKNVFSIITYLFRGTKYLFSSFDKNALNVIYHCDYPSIEDIIFLKFGKRFGYRIVYDITENIEYFDQSKSSLRMKFKNYTSRKLLKQLYKNGSICFAISTQLVDFCKTICKNKIPVIHLPISVNIEYVKGFKNRDKLISSQDKIQVFYGGSFGFKDGFEYILKGFELACERNNTVELILTGKVSKQMEGKVQSLIDSSKHKERIKFLGCLSTAEYFRVMTNADILCMCRINSEFANYGFPFKLGEYLASGNAIISTNTGDVPQYITNKENALLIEPESENQICDAILILAQNLQLRIQLGNAAQESAIKYFSSQKVSEVLYENLLTLG